MEVSGTGFDEDVVRKLSAQGFEARISGDRASIAVATEDDVPRLARLLVDLGVELFSLTPERATLEELFLEILGPEGGL